MNVLIDKERVVFLRKMGNRSVLSKLADMECPHIHTLIADANGLESLTDLELKLLIKNGNGPDVRNVFSRATLLTTAHALAASLPESKVNGFEVDMQWRTIREGDTARYEYVPGSNVPRLVDGVEELAALLGSPASVQTQAPATPVAPSAAKPAPSPSEDGFVMPREGTSTHTIFMFCARLWKESGFSDNKATLDGIRKKAVDQLVPTGLNISTVRTQAARWYQHRQRLVL